MAISAAATKLALAASRIAVFAALASVLTVEAKGVDINSP
jgi:hypothetical protein